MRIYDNPENRKAIIKERSQTYGEPGRNLASIGKGFTAIIEQHYQVELPHPIPGHVVALLMASLKLNRAAFDGEFNMDNYVDAHNFVDIATATDIQRRGLDSNDDET